MYLCIRFHTTAHVSLASHCNLNSAPRHPSTLPYDNGQACVRSYQADSAKMRQTSDLLLSWSCLFHQCSSHRRITDICGRLPNCTFRSGWGIAWQTILKAPAARPRHSSIIARSSYVVSSKAYQEVACVLSLVAKPVSPQLKPFAYLRKLCRDSRTNILGSLPVKSDIAQLLCTWHSFEPKRFSLEQV